MAEADFDSERSRQRDCFQRIFAFGRESQQQRVVSRERSQVADFFRRRIEHQRRIVRAVEAWFGRQERAFDMPTRNRMFELRTDDLGFGFLERVEVSACVAAFERATK